MPASCPRGGPGRAHQDFQHYVEALTFGRPFGKDAIVPLHDLPLTTIGDDKFSLAANVRDASDVILSATPPQCIGICGDWGSGKTSFMHFLEEAASEVATTIWFDSWKYEGAGLLYSLMRHVSEQAKQTEVAKTILRGTVVVSAAVANFASLGGLKNVEEGARIGDAIFSTDLVETKYDTLQTLSADFACLESEILKRSGGERIVVFLDDLDRCLPENAIHTLEALKNHYVSRKTVFVIGIDSKVVGRALQGRYSNFSGFDADAYLDKIFTFRLRLPPCPMSGLVHLVSSFGFPSLTDKAPERIAQTIQDCGIANPRRTKVLGYRLNLLEPVLPHIFPTIDSEDGILRVLTAVLGLHEYHMDAFVALRASSPKALALLPSALKPSKADKQVLIDTYGLNLDAYPFSDQRVLRFLKVIAELKSSEKKVLHNIFAVAERTPRREPVSP